MTAATRALADAAEYPSGSGSMAVTVIATIMFIAALRLGRLVALPVAVAVLLTLMLSAPVRWLRRHGIAERIGAALVVFGTITIVAAASALLVTPATQWIASAPETLQRLELRVRHLAQPFFALQQSADRMQHAAGPATTDAPRLVQLVSPGIFSEISFQMVSAVPIVLTVVFLTYFLLSNGPLFRRKLAGLLPGRQELQRREHLLGEIELASSRYLITVVSVNTGVGVLTGLALWALGLPSPFLWGGIAAVLNFVPYLGPVVTATIIGLAALASFPDTTHALIAPALFLGIHLTEANVITPTLLGRHLPVNTVAIICGLLAFAWMWGIPGAVLAVPLTVVVKLVCDHVPALAHVGALLDN